MSSFVFLCIVLPSLARNGPGIAAFSPSPQHRPHPTSLLRSPPHLSSSIKGEYCEYDISELMSSEWETNRFDNMYKRFDHDSWLAHRASDRFYRNVLRFPDSPVVKNLLDEVAVLLLICFALIGWNEAVVDGYTDFNEIHHAAPLAGTLPSFLDGFKITLPKDPFFLCGGPLGLLLVFRNDVSFTRYKDAIHHWETIIATLTNLLLMASKTTSDKEGVYNLGKASSALARTIQHEVSGKFDPSANYKADIRQIYEGSDDKAETLLGSRNHLFRSIYDCHEAVDAIAKSDPDGVSNLVKRTMVNSVNAVATACAECERLYTTPIPLLYTRQALSFLSLWMTFLPLALYDVFESSWNHVGMIPAVAVICFLFFGIEEIAVSLEEPFSILPLGEFVGEYESNLEDVMLWMGEEEGSAAGARRRRW